MRHIHVNYVTYGEGYCDVCGRDETLLLLGVSDYGICKHCVPEVIEQMKNVANLLVPKQKLNKESDFHE